MGSIKLSFTKVLCNLIIHSICSRDQHLICEQYLLSNKTYRNLTALSCGQCLMRVAAHTSKRNNLLVFLLNSFRWAKDTLKLQMYYCYQLGNTEFL